jgi:hypothetical protein
MWHIAKRRKVPAQFFTKPSFDTRQYLHAMLDDVWCPFAIGEDGHKQIKLQLFVRCFDKTHSFVFATRSHAAIALGTAFQWRFMHGVRVSDTELGGVCGLHYKVWVKTPQTPCEETSHLTRTTDKTLLQMLARTVLNFETMSDVICVDAINMDRIANTEVYYDFFVFGRRNLDFSRLSFLSLYPASIADSKEQFALPFANVDDFVQKCELQAHKQQDWLQSHAEQTAIIDAQAEQWKFLAFECVCKKHKKFKTALCLTKCARLIDNKGTRLSALETVRHVLSK